MPTEPNDTILRRARADLIIPEGRDRGDTFLWDHSLRIAESADKLAQICLGASVKYDRQAIRIAALYHDAGWAVQVRSKLISRFEVLSKPTSPEQRLLAAELISSRIADLVPVTTLHRAIQLVAQLNQREQTLPEGRVLADAETLDEIGLLTLWPSIRKQMLEGRDIQSFVTQWQRQIEYKFWDARIKDTIHFEVVRDMARRRLAELTEFIDRVSRLGQGEDLVEFAKNRSP